MIVDIPPLWPPVGFWVVGNVIRDSCAWVYAVAAARLLPGTPFYGTMMANGVGLLGSFRGRVHVLLSQRRQEFLAGPSGTT